MIVAVLVVMLEAIFVAMFLFILVMMLLFVETKAGLWMMIKLAVGSMAVGIFSAITVLSAQTLAVLVIIIFLVAVS